MGYTIGSFNLCDFNMASEIDKVANIIREQKFDIVALQEILPKETLLNKLAKRVGYTWKSICRLSEGRSHSHAEGYAYIWNDSRLNLIGESDIYSNDGMASKLVRPPLVCRFTPRDLIGGLPFELRLINVHIAFNPPSDTDLHQVNYRREEFSTLLREVYPSVATKGYGNFMPSYTIMMGDYNLCIVGDSKIEAYKTNGNFYDKEVNGRIYTTVQSEPTSLKTSKPFTPSGKDIRDLENEQKSAEKSTGKNDLYSQDYDHFTYDKGRFRGIGLSDPVRVDAINEYYDGNLDVYRADISDHVPIKIVLDFHTNYINIKEVAIDDRIDNNS